MKIYGLGEFHGHVVASHEADGVVFAVTRRKKGSYVPQHAHDCHSLITLIEGEHFYTSDQGKIRWSIPGAWYYSPPNHAHTHDACPTDILSAGIHCSPDFLNNQDWPTKGCLTGDTAHFLSQLFLKELTETKPQESALRSIMQILLVHFHRLESDPSLNLPPWLIKVKQDIDQDPLNAPSATQLALNHSVDPSHLSRTFRKQFGQNLSDYIRDRRLEWAYKRITATQDKLGEIAQSAGFTDHAHLCRVFKKRYGKSPSAFRS